MARIQAITPFLWFDKEAREAARVLHIRLQGFENQGFNNASQHSFGDRGDPHHRTSGSGVCAYVSGSTFQVQRIHIIRGKLQDAARN